MVTSKVAATSKRSKSSKKLADDQFADRMFRKIEKAPAWFKNSDEVERFNKKISDRTWIRRMATAVLEMSGKQLIERVEKDRDFTAALVPWYDRINDYLKMLDDVKDLVGHAQARFTLAIANREDMDQVFEEARKEERDDEGEQTAMRR